MQWVRVTTIKEDGTLGTLSITRPAPSRASRSGRRTRSHSRGSTFTPGVKRTVVSGLSWLWARAEGSLRTKTESSLVHWQQPLRTLYVGQHSCLLSTDTVRARTYYSTELTRLSCPL
jgi:hypothetical protein|eukprot:COSAG01_NODE_147_length_24095_cov_25.855428_21_plen_117_part_00